MSGMAWNKVSKNGTAGNNECRPRSGMDHAMASGLIGAKPEEEKEKPRSMASRKNGCKISL